MKGEIVKISQQWNLTFLPGSLKVVHNYHVLDNTHPDSSAYMYLRNISFCNDDYIPLIPLTKQSFLFMIMLKGKFI